MITTFQKFGKLKTPITSTPVNQADQSASYFIATGIIPQDNTIVGDLYDATNKLVATKRVYSFAGVHKNIPFADLLEGEKGYLSGNVPDKAWEIKTIKLWLNDKQAKDEDGNVPKDDPFSYPEKATKGQLLELIEEAAITGFKFKLPAWIADRSAIDYQILLKE